MAKRSTTEDMRLTLGVLAAAEVGEGVSQRGLAAELGVALGLVNAYVKRCVGKGLLKVSQAPARRYRYYLTPAGFAEKARLTGEYLSISLAFFRRARAAYSDAFKEASRRRWRSVALLGGGDLADIAMICAMEYRIVIAAIVEPDESVRPRAGILTVKSARQVAGKADGFVLASPNHADLESIAAVSVIVPKAGVLGLARALGANETA